jgi:hypothetical protein
VTESTHTGTIRLTAKALRNQQKPARIPERGPRFIRVRSVNTENLRNSRCWNDICKRQGKPRGLVPEGKAASMFEVTLITESANHKRYRVSLRSSSKRVPSNPSSNGVEWCSNNSETETRRISVTSSSKRFVPVPGPRSRVRPQNIPNFVKNTRNPRLDLH